MPPAPTSAPPAPTGPDQAAPQVLHCMYYRKHKSDTWQELFADADPERLWLWFLEFPESGHFRLVERPAHLFDEPCKAAG